MNAKSPLTLRERDEFLVVPPALQPDALIFSTSSIDAASNDWRGLERRSTAHVFQTWAWVSLWHTHIGQSRNIEPFIVTASSRDGSMHLLLPFGIQTRPGIRTLVWLGGEHADYKGPVISHELMAALTPEATRDMMRRAIALVPGIDVVSLTDMPENLGTSDNPLRAFDHQLSPVASHALALGRDFETLYKAHRSSSSRKKLRQKRRRLEDTTGPTRMKIATHPAERSRAITVLIDQKRVRLEEKGVGDMFAAPEVRAFYRSLAEMHPTLCQLSTFEAGDEAVAANWGLIWGGRYYYVLSTMTDGAARVHSPGQLHLNELIEWSIAQGLDVFDFTAGDEAYKDDWCDSTTLLFDVYFGLTIKGRVLAQIQANARMAKRRIKNSETLWQYAEKFRKILMFLRSKTAW